MEIRRDFDLTGLVSISAALDFNAQRVVGMDLDSGLIDSAKENWREMQGRLQCRKEKMLRLLKKY